MLGIKAGFWAQRPGSLRYPLGERWERKWRDEELTWNCQVRMKGFWKPGRKIRRGRFNARSRSRVLTMPWYNLIQYSMEDGATQSLNLGKKSSLWKDWMCLTHFSLLAIESCQASILILNGQCNHLHSALPGVKPNSTLGFTTHYKMRMKKTHAQEDHGEITGELWWISELNSIINHSRKKRQREKEKTTTTLLINLIIIAFLFHIRKRNQFNHELTN